MRRVPLGHAVVAFLVSACATTAPPDEAGPPPDPAAGTVPVIFNAPVTVRAGDVIALQGDAFGADPVVVVSAAGFRRDLGPLSAGDGVIVARVPADLPDRAAVTLRVREGAVTSAAWTANAPVLMHADTPEVSAGSVFRVFGRNLRLGSRVPLVRLLGPDGPLEASVDASSSDEYALTVTAPGGVRAGASYRVSVDTGAGETALDDALNGLAAREDALDLGTGWAAAFDFLGNAYDVTRDPRLALKARAEPGVDNRAALQAAIDAAHDAGGGVVDLPAGEYFVSPGLRLRSRVLLRGASRDATVIAYASDPRAADHADSGTASFRVEGERGRANEGADATGFVDLTLRNVDVTQNRARSLKVYGGAARHLVVARVRWDIGVSGSIELFGRAVLLKDAVVTSRRTADGGQHPLLLNGEFFRVSGTRVDYLTGRAPRVFWLRNSVIERSEFRLNAATANAVNITGGAVLNGSNLAVLGNAWRVDGARTGVNNDGEMLINEVYPAAFGAVSSATAGAVSEAGRDFSGSFTASSCGGERPAVGIVSGRGTGQWRFVTRASGASLEVSPPWAVVPGAGAHFTVGCMAGRNWLVRGNTFENSGKGVYLYSTLSNEVAFVGNHLVNTGGLGVFTHSYTASNAFAYTRRFSFVWNAQFIGNTVTSAAGSPSAQLFLQHGLHDGDVAFGAATIGVVFRGNTVTAGGLSADSAAPEGYVLGTSVYRPGAASPVPAGITPFLGTVFQGNACQRCGRAYHLDSGAFHTVIWDARGSSGALVEDRELPGAGGVSHDTVVGP